MDNNSSTTLDDTDGEYNAEDASGSFKGIARRSRSNVQTVQNILLIWLDSGIDDSSVDYQNTVTQLQRVMNTIKTYTDSAKCIQFIESIRDEKACMLVSGTLGQHIVPRILDKSQVESILIFCGDRTKHEQWAKKWPKIKGVFTDIIPICKVLKQMVKQYEQKAIPVNSMVTTGDIPKTNLDRLDPSFMYTQILKEILLTIQFERKHLIDFSDHCRTLFADNERELKNIKMFEKKYRDESPIWWYTNECFLPSMLNRALRLMDVDLIIKMGFFIADLHRHIEQLHKKQFNNHHSSNSFTVYRGQSLSKTEFEQVTKSKGGLTSFNNFLSTSKDRNISVSFARHAVATSDLIGVLFVMTIDPSKSTTPFALITDVSCYKTNDEVLFSMHTVFRICDIKSMDENHRLFQVELALTSDTDKALRALTDRIREETFPDSSGWYRLASLLLKIDQSDKAQEIYETLLNQTGENSEKASIYNQLGSTKYNQGEYREAMEFYQKSLEIRQRSLPPNHPDLASSYGNIGEVYRSMEEYRKALSSYEKALEIRQRSLPPNHRDLASSYGNIGEVYRSMEEYGKALSSYEKAIEIRQRSLPPNHPDLASSYDNIGLVYEDMGEYSKACSFYERALDIGQRILPPNHPSLQKQKKNLDRVKMKL